MILSKSELQTTAKVKVIGVLGAKGGVGATTISINLAAALALSSQKNTISLLDANLQQPDASCLLNCNPRFSLLDLTRRSAVDAEVIAACAENIVLEPAKLARQFRLFSPPLDANQALQVSLSDVGRLLCKLKELPGTCVVDLPRSVNLDLVSMLDLCDCIVLVLEPTVTALAAARRWLDVFQDLGIASDHLVAVLNRSGGKLKEIEKQLSNDLSGISLLRLPNAYEACEGASIEGVPVLAKYPRIAFSKAIDDLLSTCQRAGLDSQKTNLNFQQTSLGKEK
ncbi:P-loop NTPase [bacterium]|nr:P-loop NTPase [bacterium]MBP9809270.1 P-loop NTPase [bacterium]